VINHSYNDPLRLLLRSLGLADSYQVYSGFGGPDIAMKSTKFVVLWFASLVRKLFVRHLWS